MEVKDTFCGRWGVLFDDKESEFLEREASEYNLKVKEMLEAVFGILFVGGYGTIIGKESTNELEG